MLKFAANLTTMFNETHQPDRIVHAANLGFKWVEWLFPYAYDVSEIHEKLEKHGVELILINTALGDPKIGDKGIGAVPGRENDFKQAIEEAIRYIETLGIPNIHVMAGNCPKTEDRPKFFRTFARNLDWVVTQLAPSGTNVLVEPLNLEDSPGYLIGKTTDALSLMSMADSKFYLQYDFYHAQIMEGNLLRTLRENIEVIRHVQFSSLPGRHEPQYGEVNCEFLFGELEKLNYAGHVGCEYTPKTTVEAGLDWARPYGIGLET